MDRTSPAHRPGPFNAELSEHQKPQGKTPGGDTVQLHKPDASTVPARAALATEGLPDAPGPQLLDRQVAYPAAAGTEVVPTAEQDDNAVRDDILAEIRDLARHYDLAPELTRAEELEAAAAQDEPVSQDSPDADAPATRRDVVKAAVWLLRSIEADLDTQDAASRAGLAVLAYLARDPRAPTMLQQLSATLMRIPAGELDAFKDVITCLSFTAPSGHQDLLAPLLKMIEQQTTRHAQALRTQREEGMAALTDLWNHVHELNEDGGSKLLDTVTEVLEPFVEELRRQGPGPRPH